MKFIISIISALFFLTSLNAKEIKMGKADWDTGYFQAEIYKKALEKMGYKDWTNCNETSSFLCGSCCR